jgi:diguanylate cyclase (GGDEF)-like protein
MKRVSKGKLAGVSMDSPTALGIEGLSEEDAQGIAKAALGSLFDASVYLGDDGVVKACSSSFLERAGLSAQDVVGRHFKELGQGAEEAARLLIALMEAKQEGGGVVSVKLRSLKARALPAKVRLAPIDSGGSRMWLATMSLWIDGERKEAQNILSMESGEFDSATGMLGRIAFMQAASLALHREGFKDRPCVICLDLDHFGQLNRRLGQAAGDLVLEQLAERLKAQLRRGDWAGRMGSDEFCLYASFAGSRLDGQAVAERMLAALEQPFDVGDGRLEVVEATLGVALGPQDGASVADLVCSAEEALKEARAAGRRWAFAGVELSP